MADTPTPLEKIDQSNRSDIDPGQMVAEEVFQRDHGKAIHCSSHDLGLITIAIVFGFSADQSLTNGTDAENSGILDGKFEQLIGRGRRQPWLKEGASKC
ncbi:MAG: hypothetical protein P1U53_09945 [Sulfitobacter sp.]|nr:hypothetical protein [Sulfitobacter sp.]